MNPIPALLALITGSGLVYASIKNKNVVYVFRYALTGKNPADAPSTGKKPATPKPAAIKQGNKQPGTTDAQGNGGVSSDLLPNLGTGGAQQYMPGTGGVVGGYQSSYTQGGGSDPIYT